jgi:type I restriction enzyme M protein
MRDIELEQKIKDLIDGLKGICNAYGLSGDGNEYKIISQSFLYKFLNDKFIHDVCEVEPELKNADNLQDALFKKTEDEYEILMAKLGGGTAKLKPTQLISYLYAQQNVDDFYKNFNETLNDIAVQNSGTFSVHTASNKNVLLFDANLFNVITDEDKRDDAARAVINRLSENRFDFVEAFGHGFDFFSTIFEYLIKDYNTNGGGTYAEYYTPHSVARIIAKILVNNNKDLLDQKVLDPSAGSGTLLMNIAHEIGTDRCSVYSQDISQKSSNLLRLNLILNNLAHSITNVVEGNTLTAPKHTDKKFDFIVSNPPFGLRKNAYEDSYNEVKNNTAWSERFFAGIPNLPKKDDDKSKANVYLLFLQHVLWMMSDRGKAAIVVPTGFITAHNTIERKIRERLVEKKWLKGVVSMPSNIFATTGTNVSVIFIDKTNQDDKVTLVDASKLGDKIKEGKNQKTVLRKEEEEQIINAFLDSKTIEDFSIKVDYDEIKDKDYSFSAGQYFEVKIQYPVLTKDDFDKKINSFKNELNTLFAKNDEFQKQINDGLDGLSQ